MDSFPNRPGQLPLLLVSTLTGKASLENIKGAPVKDVTITGSFNTTVAGQQNASGNFTAFRN